MAGCDTLCLGASNFERYTAMAWTLPHNGHLIPTIWLEAEGGDSERTDSVLKDCIIICNVWYCKFLIIMYI